jgi:hypothetical protein
MDWIKRAIFYICFIGVFAMLFVVLLRGFKCDDRGVIRPQEEIKHSEQWFEVKPEVVTEIDERKLPEDEASEEICRLREQVEWYATYTAQLKKQLLSGGADIEVFGDGDITLHFSGERDFGRYEGICGVLDGEGWHELKLTFNPIPLRLYDTGETVNITTPADWVQLGEVEIVRELPQTHWYENVRLGVMVGVEHSSDGYSPAFGLQMTINGWGVSLLRVSDGTAIMTVGEWEL